MKGMRLSLVHWAYPSREHYLCHYLSAAVRFPTLRHHCWACKMLLTAISNRSIGWHGDGSRTSAV